ncbi:MAG: hypothetical protein COB54_06515 [Alphaproteobacteria bacterium]|nr:MAG: hypothetical protein COB54_06515 [Alphaproteobacteria bacterium]
MPVKFSALALGLTGVIALTHPLYASETSPSNQDQRVQEARGLIKNYAGQLKTTLVHAIKTDGAIAAIDVCARQAPEIALSLSEDSPWTIGRTSLKARNSGSAPDAWELTVMADFQKRLQAGEDIKTLDHQELTENGTVFRYMKAIPTGGLCLTCHGESIAPDLKHQILSFYPDDRATGFKAGDIRGAFTLQKDLSD